MNRIFFLSPAHSGGKRAQFIFNPRATFPLARQLQRGEKIPLGEIFRFLSGLYFRGKLAYSAMFATSGIAGSFIITSNRGLVESTTPTTLDELRAFSAVPIDPSDERYRVPLKRAAEKLANLEDTEFILLGSISTGKYVDVLLDVFGRRLYFPSDFVGRGDMSRGGLMLRAVRDKRELAYERVAGAIRRGTRPPKLSPHSWRETPWAAQTPSTCPRPA